MKTEGKGIVWSTYRTPLHFPSITGPFYKREEPYKELPRPARKMDNFDFPEQEETNEDMDITRMKYVQLFIWLM